MCEGLGFNEGVTFRKFFVILILSLFTLQPLLILFAIPQHPYPPTPQPYYLHIHTNRQSSHPGLIKALPPSKRNGFRQEHMWKIELEYSSLFKLTRRKVQMWLSCEVEGKTRWEETSFFGWGGERIWDWKSAKSLVLFGVSLEKDRGSDGGTSRVRGGARNEQINILQKILQDFTIHGIT